MPLPASRSVVIISGLLTLFVLAGLTLGLAFHNGWLRTAAADTPTRETELSPATPTQGRTQDAVGVYREKLAEAYRALDDAYVQLRALQSPQPQLASARNDDERLTEHAGDDDRRGRPSDRRRSHED